MIVRCHLACLVSVVSLLGTAAMGQTRPAQPPRPPAAVVPPKPVNLDPPKIGEYLRSNDNFQVEQAMAAAVGMFAKTAGAGAAKNELPNWIKILNSQRRVDEVEELALAAICANAGEVKFIEQCQEYRIRAKLIAGKPKEALALARGYYNVCAMPNTSRAIELACECLYDLNKDKDPGAVVKRFKLQQVVGASGPLPAGETAMLLEAEIDPKPYKSGIETAELDVNGFTGLTAKGNLLLLAGQIKEAEAVFDKAYSLASEKNLAVATEGKARVMRARDGTVFNANTWILSLRPDGTAPTTRPNGQ